MVMTKAEIEAMRAAALSGNNTTTEIKSEPVVDEFVINFIRNYNCGPNTFYVSLHNMLSHGKELSAAQIARVRKNLSSSPTAAQLKFIAAHGFEAKTMVEAEAYFRAHALQLAGHNQTCPVCGRK